MADNFTPINTQEELDKVIGSRIKRAEEKYAGENESLRKQMEEMKNSSEALKTQYDALKLQLSDATKSMEEKDNKIKGFELINSRNKVAKEFGIPEGLIGRLSGDDEESMRKDAEALSNTLKEMRPTPPKADNESSGQTESKKDQALKNMLGKLNGGNN